MPAGALLIGDSGHCVGVVMVVAGQGEGLVSCHMVTLRGEQEVPTRKKDPINLKSLNTHEHA